MGTSRESIIRGPGAVKLGTNQFFDKEGIDANLEVSSFDVSVSAFGKVDTRRADALCKIGFTPSGRVTQALLDALYPYGTPVPGSEIFGDTDVPVEVHSLAGKKVVFAAGAITGMPDLNLTARGTLFAAAEITTVIANEADRTDANSMYEVSDAAFSGPYDVGDIKCGPVSAAWGAVAPFDDIKTKEGWKVSFDLQLEPVVVDDVGTIGMQMVAVNVKATCMPMHLSEANILDALNSQGADGAIGSSMRTSNDLVLTTSFGLVVTLKNAALVEGPLKWGATDLRAGELGFEAHRDVSGDTAGAVFSVVYTPPV